MRRPIFRPQAVGISEAADFQSANRPPTAVYLADRTDKTLKQASRLAAHPPLPLGLLNMGELLMRKTTDIFITLLLFSTIQFAQWSTDPSVNLEVSPWGNDVTACSDGRGGVYIGWVNFSYEFTRAYLQHVDKYGYISWDEPLEILDQGLIQKSPDLLADGNGNCIATVWASDTIIFIPPAVEQYELIPYHQKIDINGNRLWDINGVRSSQTYLQNYINTANKMMRICSDNEGGIFLNWYEWKVENEDEIFTFHLQRITSEGDTTLGINGKVVGEIINGVLAKTPLMVSDGTGGVILWYGSESTMKFERIDAEGNVLWSTQTPSSDYEQIAGLGTHGAVVTGKHSNLGGVGYNLIINAIDENGILLFDEDKIIVDSMYYNSRFVNSVYNDENELTFFGYSYKINTNDPLTNRYQVMRKNGDFLFGENGKPISTYPINKSIKSIILSENNIICFWAENRDSLGYWVIYAQKLDTLGNQLWDSTDVAISLTQTSRYQFTTDCNGGAILVKSYDPNYGVYAQQVSKNGNLGEVLVSVEEDNQNTTLSNFELYQNYPNPFNPSTIIEFELPKQDFVTLKLFNVLGEEIATLINKELEAGKHKVTFNPSNQNLNLSSGVFLYRLKTGNQYRTKKLIYIK